MGATLGVETTKERSFEATVRPAAPARQSRRRPSRVRSKSGTRPNDAWVAIVLVAALATPFVVALLSLRSPRWYPIGDQAVIEMRLRDVLSWHPPLVGAWGRYGAAHPGPLYFYLLAPIYRVFGSTAWAMQSAAIGLHLAALIVVVWAAVRRGGAALALGVSTVLALLVHFFGAGTFTDPWNPYAVILWWAVFLMAVWSVLCDDYPLLPVVAFAGSLVVQAHVGYLLGVLGLGALAVGAGFRAALINEARSSTLRTFGRWVFVSLGIGFVVWIPPLVDELAGDGNLSKLRIYASNPPRPPIGWGRGVELMLVHLDPLRFVRETIPVYDRIDHRSIVPGIVFLAVWAVSVFVARRLQSRTLVRLDLVLAVGLGLGAVSMSRIFGDLWYYLTLWAWVLTAFMVLAVGWTAAIVVDGFVRSLRTRKVWVVAGVLTLITIGVVSLAALTAQMAGYENAEGRQEKTLNDLVEPTAAALEASGRGDRYLVDWVDPVGMGAEGIGLINELDRRGFRVGARAVHQPQVTQRRVFDARSVRGQVTLVVGPEIATWRKRRDQRELVYRDPRSPRERLEYRRDHARVIRELNRSGLHELVSILDDARLGVAMNPRITEKTRRLLRRLTELGTPSAVFLGPT
jgi:hypothetical protein